jgi:TatD DNase family protein
MSDIHLDLVDSHAHLADEQFAADLPEVIDRAAAAGVRRIVTIGTTAADSRVGLDLARRFAGLGATVGIQPNNAAAAAPGDWDEIVRLAAEAGVVAVGETGLDRHWDYTPFGQQEDYFTRHLELARQQQLPVVIHCREAEADVIRMLQAEIDRHGPVRGVMHSYTGDALSAATCLALGLHISFAGMVTFKNARALRAVARTVPLDRLLIETDSPYLAPVPVRGKRNEPANLVHTAGCLANLFGIAPAVLAEHCTRNARLLFPRLPV